VIHLTTDGTVLDPDANDDETADHWRTRHWMPWVLPLLAILLPVLEFVVTASIAAYAMRWGGTRAALGRGDFLIPVLILCLEAFRRWWLEVKWDGWKRTAKWWFMTLCGTTGFVCYVAFQDASSHPVTPATTRSITAVTLGCLIVSLVLGTWAVVVSTPDAEGT
jgi:hypothetical protein